MSRKIQDVCNQKSVTISGRTIRITIPKSFLRSNPVLVKRYYELIEILGDYKRNRKVIPAIIVTEIESLPNSLRDKLIKSSLYEGLASVTIPMLGEFLFVILPKTQSIKKDGTSKTKGTIKQYKYYNQYLLEYFGKVRIDTITNDKAYGIKDYLKQRRKGKKLSPATVNKAVRYFREIFRKAVKLHFIKESPFEDVPGGDDSNPARNEHISFERVEALIVACKDLKNGLEYAGAIRMFRYGGCRPSELLDMKFSDFKENGVFYVPNTGKTGFRKGLDVFGKIMPTIKELRGSTTGEYVFPVLRKSANIGSDLKRNLKEFGLDWERTCSNLRASFQNDLRKLGYQEWQITAMSGNSQKVREKHYYHQNISDDEVASWSFRADKNADKYVSESISAPISSDYVEWFEKIDNGLLVTQKGSFTVSYVLGAIYVTILNLSLFFRDFTDFIIRERSRAMVVEIVDRILINGTKMVPVRESGCRINLPGMDLNHV